MKKINILIIKISRNIILAIIGVALVAALMLFRNTSITPGFSEREVNVYQQSKSSAAIIDDPINAPYKIASFIAMKTLGPETGIRSIGALIGIIATIIMFALARQLYGGLIAVAVSAMFASSGMILTVTKLASPTVMLLSLFVIIACGAYVKFGKYNTLGWVMLATATGVGLYAPGTLLFIVPAIIWQFKYIKDSLASLDKKYIVLISAILSILVMPIIISIIRDPGITLRYLGFSQNLDSITEMLRYSYAAIASLFVISPLDSAYWLGRLPALDVFATAVFICGAYQLATKYKLHRFWLILGISLIGIVWIGITTNRYSIIILLPFVYLVIGSGLRFLIDKWFSVFPRNPLPKYFGSTLLVFAVAMSINFQLQRFFVAWPNSKITQEAFSHQLPVQQ